MKNRELFNKDPTTFALLNEGVARVADELNEAELQKLRFELTTFVCKGQYALGLERILRSYLDCLRKPDQPAVWVSGFFGSGKSHLVKVLQYLWLDYQFADGATARGVANLPTDARELFKELSTAAKRAGGLHAAAGMLGAGAGSNVRLALLSIVLRSVGLPEDYAKARFALWLKKEEIYDQVKAQVTKAGKDFAREISYMYVSDTLAQAILTARPSFAKNPADARLLLKTQFPVKENITLTDMQETVKEALTKDKEFPCTLIALDEVQQYIGDNSDRTYEVQEVTEACSKHFGGRLLFVATGQSALSSTPNLQKLMARFRIPVQLLDTDVETVAREMVLAKKQDKLAELKNILETCSGEISRHLAGTKLGPIPEDDAILAADYPILPVRRRFWEVVLRQVDRAGTTAQLRTQLRVILDAARATANQCVGNVAPADFLFDQVSSTLVQTGVLLRKMNEVIRKQDDGTAAGRLRYRLCALIFLIDKLPRDLSSDLGVRATPEMLADLMVTDLLTGSADLRKQIPELLQSLVAAGDLMQVGSEYRLQTPEGSAWDSAYRDRLAKIANDDARLADIRMDVLRKECGELLKNVRVTQGASKVGRRIEQSFASEPPANTGQAVPLWVRNGWSDDEKSVLADIRKAGPESPLVTIYMPRRSAEELKNSLCSLTAAEETLAARGMPSTPEGQEARRAMDTRRTQAQNDLKEAIAEILAGVRVFMAGGNEISRATADAAVQDAATSALARLFPQFDLGDDPKWANVVERAKKGDGGALEALGYSGDVDKQPVCKHVRDFVEVRHKGSEVRRNFTGTPFGWPQDTVDGALLTLFLNGLVRATQDGKLLDRKQLDQTKIGVADFTAEAEPLGAKERIAIRKTIGTCVDCKAGEETLKAPVFVAELLRRAQAAGGDPPVPERPNAAYVHALEAQSGNDQLALLYQERERLQKDAAAWKKAGETIEKRLPRWEILQRLLTFAAELPVAAEVRPQADAICTNRSLLAEPDPVPPLCKKVGDELRVSVHAACAQYNQAFSAQMESLAKNTRWKEVGAKLQGTLLAKAEVAAAAEPKIGTEDEILRALEEVALREWKSRTDALPTRFQNVQMDVAKIFEPKAVHVRLPSATLKTEPEVDAWLKAAKDTIMSGLKDGPVVIS